MPPTKPDQIYHLVTETDFRSRTGGGLYTPARFEQDGFIHCTAEPETLLAVAADYFSTVAEPLLVLIINLPQLTAEVKFEPPAPIEGGGVAHLKPGRLFPHIYGPLNLDAIAAIGLIQKKDGRYHWPQQFITLDQFL